MGNKRVRNTSEFIAKAIIRFNGRFKYPNTIFNGQDEDIEFECPYHGTVVMTAKSHLKRGCKYCNGYFEHTRESFIQLGKEKHNNFYDYSLIPENWHGVLTPVDLICPLHGVFKTTFGKHITLGHGCQKCGIIKQTKARSLTTDEFVKRAMAKWPNMNDYQNTVYVNRDTDIEYNCLIHGAQTQKPVSHIKYGCLKCNGKKIARHTWGTFVQAANVIHDSIYNYTIIGEFPGLDSYIDIICPIHGIFQQKASRHISSGGGDGCPKCNGGAPITHQEYESKCHEKFNHKFEYVSKYTNSHDMITCRCPKHGEFSQRAYTHLASAYGCPQCAAESQQSMGENELAMYIQSLYDGTILRNQTKIIPDKRELDIYLPELKLAIEYNGLYYHREMVQGTKMDIIKTKECEKLGIKLIQIYDLEWNKQKDIVKSRIASILGKNKVIYAKNTVLVNITFKNKDVFLDQTHIQGSDTSSVYYGLMYEDELVSVMTFGKPRYTKNNKYQWELIRFSSKLGINVVGGASKLLAHFRKNYSGSILSYADRRWSTGGLYFKLGFKLDNVSGAGLYYYDTNNHILYNRMHFTRKDLIKMNGYSDDLTAYEIMKLNGYDRIWDCGQLRFTLE